MSAIRVELELADGSFTTRMLHAGETVQRFNDNVLRSQPALNRVMTAATQAGQAIGVFANGTNLAFTSVRRLEDQSRSFLATMRDMTVIVGMAGAALSNVRSVATGWAGSIVKVNSEMEALKTQMASMSRASDPLKAAADDVRYLREEARNAPFTLHALADGFTRLKATGIDPTTGSLRAFEDAVAAAGGGDERLKRVSLAISQMAGKGVIQMEELRQQLGEALPRATELMARAMGVTYGQLVKDISTGTVQAMPAIKALQLELEMVFGGASARMMNTFQGQLSRTTSLLQELSLKAGEAGYFEAVKTQLRDLNTFLASPKAASFARDLGEGLTKVVGGLRAVVDFTVAWRSELGMLAQTAALFVGGKLLLAGFSTMAGMITKARSEIALLRTEWTLLGATQAAGATAAGAAGLANGAAAVTATAAATTTLGNAWRAAIPWLARGSLLLGALGPVALAAGGALYLLGSYFEIGGSRAREAALEIEKNGARTREDLAKTTRAYEEQSAVVKKLEENHAWMTRRAAKLPSFTPGVDESAKKLEAAREEQAAAKARVEKAQYELDVQQERERTQIVLQELNKRREASSRIFDEESVQAAKAHEKTRAELIKANKTTEVADKSYQNETRARRLKFYDDEIAAIEAFVVDRRKLLEGPSAPVREAAGEAIANANKDLVRLFESRRSLQEMDLGVAKTPKETNLDVLLKKAGDQLNRLKGDIEGFKAEMAGAHGETAKLAYQLDQAQKFGDPTNAKIREMRDNLIAAQEQAAKFHDILEGRKSMDGDIRRSIQEVRGEIARTLNGGELTKADEILTKFNAGGYGAFNPSTSPMVTTTEALARGFGEVKRFADQAAEAMRTGTFSAFMHSQADKLVSTVERLAAAWRSVGQGVAGVDMSTKLQVPPALQQLGQTMLNQVVAPLSRFLPASIRNNNPGAMWPGDSAARFGAIGYQNLNDGQGNKIATFATPEQGAAAQFDLLLRSYVGKTLEKAIEKWSGGNTSSDYADVVAGKTGIGRDAILTPGMIQNPTVAIALAKAMAQHEAGRAFPMSDDQWLAAHQAFLSAGARAGAVNGVPPTAPITGVSRIATPALPGNMPQEMETLKELERLLSGAKSDQALANQMKQIQAEIRETSGEADGFNKRYAAMRKMIESGRFGTETNPDAERYRTLIELARQWDTAEKQVADRKKAVSAATSGQEQQQKKLVELQERLKAANVRFQNPLTDQDPNARSRLIADLQKYVEDQKAAYGTDHANYKTALDLKAQTLRTYDETIATERVADLRKQTLDINRSLMNEKTAREVAANDAIARAQELLRSENLSAETRMRLEREVAEFTMAKRREVAAQDPLARTFKEWGDLQARFSDVTVNSFNSATDALATFIVTGQTDWRALTTQILTDITRMGIRWMTAGIFQTVTGKGGTGTMAKGGGKGKLGAGVAHTGGIIGAGGLDARSISPLAFAGAPKFHTGGMIRGLGLGPDEVPIIAKRGEGVFTPEQMKAMGSIGRGGNIGVTNNVTLNASGGSREQNADLARQVGQTIEATTRQIVVDEMRRQMRPGGMTR